MTSGSPDLLERQGRTLVESLGGRWGRAGGLCRCPAHEDRTPSLSVRRGMSRLLFHCFAGCNSSFVIRALAARRLLPASQGEAARRDLSTKEPGPERNAAAARRLWELSMPLAGSPASEYLRRRGLTVEVEDLRYHPRAPLGSGPEVRFAPALIAAVRDARSLVAVHRTFLDAATGRLAPIRGRKRSLGALGGGAVRLRRQVGGVLGWAEGIESALAATQLTGTACWATLGTERFARVTLPAEVRRLILFLDNDAGGCRAERLARAALRQTAVEIEVRRPPQRGMDWNDFLLARPPGA